MSRPGSDGNSAGSRRSSNSKSETPRFGQVYKFEADFGNFRDWPSHAVAWLAMMEENVKTKTKEGLVTDRQKLELYASMLGYGPATRLMWARKLGHVRDFKTFIDWFKARYIDFIEKSRLEARYQNVRHTSTLHQYISDFERVHRANHQLVPLPRVLSIFLGNMHDRQLALLVEARLDADTDLEDAMVTATFCADEFKNGRRSERPIYDMSCVPLSADCIYARDSLDPRGQHCKANGNK